MKSKDILVIFLVIFALSFSIYRRYAKKNQTGAGGISKQPGSASPPESKNDDYEPYSGK